MTIRRKVKKKKKNVREEKKEKIRKEIDISKCIVYNYLTFCFV
jgi:hypothetical protein